MNVETKGIVDEIVSGVVKVLGLDQFASKISQLIKNKYQKGLDGSEVKFGMNFIPQDSDVAFLQQYVAKNVESVSDEVGNQLRQEISRGLIAGDDVQGIKDRVKEVFGDQKYSNRLKTILRTETLRAENQGSLQGAMQSNIDLKKYVLIVNDARTSAICHAENAKYGTPEEAIPLNEQFSVNADNKTIKALTPPFHVNCRSTLLYTQVEE